MSASGLLLALRAIGAHPVRSVLLVQGLAWAVALPVFLASVLEGTLASGQERAAEVGTGRINIAADVYSGGRRLRPSDGEALVLSLRDQGVAVEASGSVTQDGKSTLAVGAVEVEADVLRVTGEQHLARGQTLALGRAPVAPDEVALEPELAHALGVTAVGGAIEFRGKDGARSLRCVGLLAPRSETALVTNDLGLSSRGPFAELAATLTKSLGVPAFDDAWKRSDACALVGAPTVAEAVGADPRSGGGTSTSDAAVDEPTCDWIFVRIPPTDAPRAAELVSAFLSERGVTPLVHTNLIWPVLAGGTIKRFASLFEALVLYCLLLGLVVVTCLLLHSVARRTVEFAIRRAEGATARDIASQVLWEAALLGLLGGLTGVPIGLVLAEVRVGLAPYTLLATAFPTTVAFGAVSASIVAGCVAGLVPAMRAARVPPVVAMRAGS